MREVLKHVHKHDTAQQVLIEGANGEGMLDIFADSAACFWERYFLCAFSGWLFAGGLPDKLALHFCVTF